MDKVELEESLTLELMYKAIEMKSRGEEVYSLAAGDPYFPTPLEIVEVAKEAMVRGLTHYTDSRGLRTVRSAASEKVRRINNINATPEEVVFIPSKFALYATFFALVNNGGEILVPDPGYLYSGAIKLAGGEARRYTLREPSFNLDIEEVEKAVTEKTVAIVVNTPSNPTGRVFPEKSLRELFEFADRRNLYIISDEAYEDIVFEGDHFSIGSLEERPTRVVSVYSLSKSFSMTGWRAGYVVANSRLVDRIKSLIENTITCFPPFIQEACSFALDHQEKLVSSVKPEYLRRRNLLYQILGPVESLKLNEVEGTFYAFPKYVKEGSSREIAEELLKVKRVATVPGVGFGPGGEGRIRISFCQSEEELKKGLYALVDYFSAI
ncbi:aminotransferase [Sulfodiicoccus acidiphilus]|uniref:Aminotransferase n=1 Tax=Sulfodiicoccus acidiphilus TaxID=1670455 RepID=A0A348B1J1_9CREN|nr:pyridoxal phosphate-dependent aminotransferase [Sulfodiicoccus acidiphilus]BBD72043.1 aminotransferase [Sulfodiicoccus acidiphilus]GGU00205.1 aminotransferase [Sulfodiicoccus acidiphilus]